ncbi:MAG: DUF721 domain-containing protein [Gammaproteobacteria bacterium]|nr:DUF721 domain-containing protein [Gammaproteobacteria bacterium]
MDKEKLQTLQNSIKQYRRSCSYSKVPTLNERLSSARGGLGKLVDNLNRIKRLSQSLKLVLQQPLADHCRVAHWRENVLVLAVDSSQWANRLRFEKLSLLTKLRQNGFPNVSSIDIIVQPDDFQ